MYRYRTGREDPVGVVVDVVIAHRDRHWAEAPKEDARRNRNVGLLIRGVVRANVVPSDDVAVEVLARNMTVQRDARESVSTDRIRRDDVVVDGAAGSRCGKEYASPVSVQRVVAHHIALDQVVMDATRKIGSSQRAGVVDEEDPTRAVVVDDLVVQDIVIRRRASHSGNVESSRVGIVCQFNTTVVSSDDVRADGGPGAAIDVDPIDRIT